MAFAEMLTITKERVAIVLVTALLLWSSGPTPPHVAAAVVGVAFFWSFVGPRGSTNVGCAPETHAYDCVGICAASKGLDTDRQPDSRGLSDAERHETDGR